MFALLAACLPLSAAANDFPTVDRVEYVLECMKDNGGKQEFLYKCSCAVDQIAGRLKYDEYVTLSTAQRYQSIGGERGALFRDPPDVKKAAKNFKAIEQAARSSCFGR